MYEVYLIIAIVQLAFSVFGISYVIYTMLSVKSKCYMQLSEALTTLSIGIFFLVGFILLKSDTEGLTYNIANKQNVSQITPTTSKGVQNYMAQSNLQIHAEARNNNAEDVLINSLFDSDRYVNHNISILPQLINGSKIKVLRGYKSLNSTNQTLDLMETYYPADAAQHSNCDLQDKVMEHALLVYSFVHGIMALINATYDCKQRQRANESREINNEEVKESIRINVKPKQCESVDETCSENSNRSDDIPDTIKTSNLNETSDETKLISGTEGRFVILLLILITWLLPALSASSICLFTNCIVKTQNFNDYFSHILTPLNVTTSNTTQVNNVIDKIYNIMHNASNTNDLQNNYSPIMNEIVSNLNNNIRYSRMIKISKHDNLFKMHTFFIFIIMNFFTISYVNIECAKMEKCVHKKKLKLFIYTFILNWSPTVFDTFARVYIYDTKPQLLSNILLAIGNAHKLLLNFHKLRDINKTNNV